MTAAAVADSGPPAPSSGGAPPVACPQCGNFWGVGSLFVRDMCGHRKCRGCVIVEGNECGTCSLQAEAATGQCTAEPSPASPAKEMAGVPAGQAACNTEGSAGGTTPAPDPVSEPPSSGTQQANRNVKISPSNITASCSKKNTTPQQSTGKKVLDELNVTNASNVAELARKDSADAEAVDDPEPLPESDKPTAKRPPHLAHGVVKLPGLPVTYCCTICGHKFKSRSTIRYHYYCGVENKPLTCELCKKGFVSKSHYQYHMRDHAGDLPFKCEVCGKGFKQKTKLKRHTIVHTDDRKFKCSTCGKLFVEASNLRVHSRLHTGERPFKCEHCGRSFNERANYNKHVRSIHTNERPYACEMCGKCFARSENLKVHLRRHEGTRPYECPVCSLTFSYKKDMTRHMPVHDSSVRPFECDKCSQTFKRKDNLVRHIRLSHNEDEKDEEPQDVSGEKSTGAEAAPHRETRAGEARSVEPGSDKTEGKAGEEADKRAGLQGSAAAERVAPEAGATAVSAGEAAHPQAKPDADKQPAGTSAICSSAADANASRPLRKRRVRAPLDASASCSLPTFRRNVTPPPGALPDPPRVPRHCLPTPRERHAVLQPPVPVDFLEAAGEKKTPRSRAAGRKRPRKEVECDSTDIQKVGFIQVPQYPPKPAPAPQPLPAQTRESTLPALDGGPKTAEPCGAVPVIRRPQASNCVRTITKAPQQAVSTIVSPRNRPIAPKPTHTAPPLPPLPACSPRPDQPMLRLLLHDTPCSDSPQVQLPPAEAPPAEAPPAPPAPVPRPAEGFGLCDVYECILRGDLGQLTGGRPSSNGRQHPTAGMREWQPQSSAEQSRPLSREPCHVTREHVSVPQDRPATKRSPVTMGQLGVTEMRSVTSEVRTAAWENCEPVPPEEVVSAHRHFPTAQSVQQSYREQQWAAGQPPPCPSSTPLSAGKGKHGRAVDGDQPPSVNASHNLDEFDTYCSIVRIRAMKQTVVCGKKSGTSTFVEEDRRHSTYAAVRRTGKRMSAISDRLSDDNEEDDEGALNYTLYGCGSGGKQLPDLYSPDGPSPRDGYPESHFGSRGNRPADVLDVIAQLRDCVEDRAVPYGSRRAQVSGGVPISSPHQDLTAPSSAQQSHVIVGTGECSDTLHS